MSLTLDDVDDVLSHLSKSGYVPVLAAGSAVATDADSLKSATTAELTRVGIGVEDKSITIYLRSSYAQIEYRLDDQQAERVANEIASILRPHRTPGLFIWLRFVGRYWLLFGAFMLAFLGILVAFTIAEPQALFGQPLLTMLLLFLGIAALLGSFNFATERTTGGAKIRPYFRRERREVTVSLSVTIWIAVASAVLSGAAGAAVTWLLTGM